MADRDIHHIHTTPYHPESNGLVERFNGILKAGIQVFIRDGTSWNEGLRRLLTNYRGTPHGSDAKSPSERMFGRAFRQPHQVVPSTQLLTTVQPPSRLAPGVPTTSKRSTLQKGDEVLLRDLRTSVGKGEATWQSTPYTILHRNNKTYTLKRSDGRPPPHLVRHGRYIKRFHRPDDMDSQGITLFETPNAAPPSRPKRTRRASKRYGDPWDSSRLRFR